MSKQSNHPRITAFLLVAVALMLACGISTSSASAPGAAATQAALQIQGTAMVLQLTQAALNSGQQVQPANSPGAATAQNTSTATVAPRIVLDPNAVEITYGQSLSHYPRKNQGVTYGFKGTQDDVVTILVGSSNARPASDPKCIGLTASTTFTLKTPNTVMAATNEATHLSTIRDYKLTATGAYYLTITCVGGGCNGYCSQADVSVNKSP
jgi:hypothetical protein